MELDSEKHFFTPRLELIDLIEPLLELADRFSCTIEMTTYLTMLLVGGPKKFFLWYCDSSWLVSDKTAIPSRFQESFSHCADDLELALLLMKAWFQSGSTYQEREEWAKTWQIKHEALIYAIEHKRDQLLSNRFFKKSDEEFTRPVDLRLIPKVRLLIAYHLVHLERLRKRQEKGLSVKGGIYRKGFSSRKPGIHPDSVCHGRRDVDNFLYFFPDQYKELREIEAQQVISLPPRWLDWLWQKERDWYDLAYFLAKETRYEDIIERPIQSSRVNQLVFLGQFGSTMFEPFAIQKPDDENIIKKPDYKFSTDTRLQGIREYQKYQGKITNIITLPDDFRVLVKLPNGLTGTLYKSGLWGQCNDVRNDEHIHISNMIPVYIKFINRQTGYIELDAHVPELNPLEQFQVGQEVEGIVEQAGQKPQSFILVRIHSRVKPVICQVHDSDGDDMRKLYKAGDNVTCLIKELIRETEHILLELTSSPHT